MITALPEGLSVALDETAKLDYHENYTPDCGCVAWEDTTEFVRECYRAKPRKHILDFLNAALDAGVAREARCIEREHTGKPEFYTIRTRYVTNEFPAIIIRTGT